MSLFQALFGGANGLPQFQAPEMAGNLSFGQRLMSGSPLNSMLNGPFPDAPGARQNGNSGFADIMAAAGEGPQAPQIAPMAQSVPAPDLATMIQQYLAARKIGD